MTLTRDATAKALGYRGQLAMTATGQLSLKFAEAAPTSKMLRLTLHHPTRAGFDRQVLLARAANGSYGAAMPPIEASRWSMTLEDGTGTWRLTGDWNAGEKSVALGDPTELVILGQLLHASRTAVYTLGFFILWAICTVASALSCFLQATSHAYADAHKGSPALYDSKDDKPKY